jgi:hypothetical protein
MLRSAAAALLVALGSASYGAAAENEVPSCYAAIDVGLVPAKPQREVLVFVDQTTPLDPALKANVLEQVGQLITPGTAFTVASFSAFSQGRFTTVQSSGMVELPVPSQQRGELSVPKLKKLDACLAQQGGFGKRKAVKAVGAALAGASNDLAKSDVLASLKQLSARAAGSRAKDRIVLIVSDMLEHSSTTSFYSKKTLKKLDPKVELDKAKDGGLVGNFENARVFVIGAASLPGDGYRGEAELASLEAFWRAWIKQSKGRLVEFGRPNLLQPVH